MEENKNNFKDVFEREAPEKLKEDTLRNTEGSVNTVRSFFDILDVYISKFIDAVVHSFSSAPSTKTGLALGSPIEEEKEEEELKDIPEENNEIY